MTRATEFCDQHGLMPLYPSLPQPSSKGCPRKAEAFLEMVEPLQFAIRSAVAKKDVCVCRDAIDRPRRPDPTGIFGVRSINDRINPSETRLAASMPAG